MSDISNKEENIVVSPKKFYKRRGKNRFPHRKPVISLVPNILTLSGMCCGLTGIHMALVGNMTAAIITILMAAFFDGIDGRVARKLGMASRFGAELDSLADSATFGISPAVIVYIFSLHEFGKFGWFIALLFAMCMALRLARFNTHSIENSTPLWMSGFATGIPAPAGAYILLLPLMISQWLHITIYVGIYALWTLITAGLLVSRIPTFLFKKKKSFTSPQYAIFIFLGVIIFIGLIYSFPWIIMILTGIAYIALIPVSAKQAYQKKIDLGGC